MAYVEKPNCTYGFLLKICEEPRDHIFVKAPHKNSADEQKDQFMLRKEEGKNGGS